MKQKKTYPERIESAKEIIADNIQVIYHMPARYKYLDGALQHEGIRKTLLNILNFIKNKEVFIYKRKYCFFLDNKKITQIRGKTTASVSSRYINYLCCLGVINKQYQTPEPGLITGINLQFMIDNDRKRPINTFYFRRYTDQELQRIEDRAKLLHDSGITAGNISYNKLCANGCQKLAREVFYANNKHSIDKKQQELKTVLQSLTELCETDGYTTKKKIYAAVDLPEKELDKVFKIFKDHIWQQYQYKPPTKQDTELYNLKNKKWIIKKRED